MTFMTCPYMQISLLGTFTKGVRFFFLNTILLQYKQERFGVGGLVRA